MVGMIVVEVLGRKNAVVRRECIDGSTVTIGRAYDNDVILDDASMDPHHARITSSGEDGFTIEDLESSNGTWIRGHRVSGSALVTTLGPVSMGRTTIRFAAADTPVAPASLTSSQSLRDRDLRWWMATGIAVAALLANYAATSQATYAKLSAGLTALGGLGLLVIWALWAGAWALGTRLARGRSFFGHHFAITAVAVVLFAPQTAIQNAVETIWAAENSSLWLGWFFAGTIGFVMLYAHVDVASMRSRAVKALIAGGLVGGLAALAALGGVGSKNSNTPLRDALGAIAPVPAGFIRSTDPDSFDASLQALKIRLDPPSRR